jgi:uncharacterized repeat protein (TIGR01451 family)
MNKKIKKIIGITLVLLSFALVLFISIINQKTKDKSISPAAPQSLPKAAIPESCNTITFRVIPETPELTCEEKSAWEDDPRNSKGKYYLTKQISSYVEEGQTFVYSISYKNNGTATVKSAKITDIIPSQLDFVDSDNECNYSSTNRTVTCDIGEVVPGAMSQVAIRVKVKNNANQTAIKNEAVIITGNLQSTCDNTLTIAQATPTITPTPTPTNNPTPTITPTATPRTTINTPTPTITPIPPTSVNQPTPTPEISLPDSGASWPTILGIAGGAIMLIMSLLLAL